MALENQISVEIPEKVITEVTTKIQECRTMLAPFLQALTADDRSSLFKMGNKSLPTVQKVKSYIATNPEFIPGYMQKEEFLKDEMVVTQLTPITNLIEQLFSDVDDTRLLAGSEALQASLLYYGQIKEANKKGVTSAKPIYEDLKQRFSKK